MIFLQRMLNALFIYVLCAVLLAGYAYQWIFHQEPCVLCLLQRFGMLGVAISLLMNLRFGIRAQYYGLAILSALLGRLVALRQIGLHVCPEISTYGKTVFGFDLYIWSYMVFTCSIFSIAVLLILKGFAKSEELFPTWGFWGKLAFWLLFALALCDAALTYFDCGFTSCIPDA